MKSKAFIVFLLSMLLSVEGWAQYNSVKNIFSVDEKKGCAPLTVTITHPAPLGPNTACGDEGYSCVLRTTRQSDGAVRERGFAAGDTVKFASDGIYRLEVIYSTTTIHNDEIEIQATPNIAPAFDAYSCNGSKVKVQVKDNNYAYYIFNYGAGYPEVTQPAISNTHIHSYTTPPTPTIPSNQTVRVRGYNGPNTLDNCVNNPVPVSVAPTLPTAAITQVEVLSGTEVKVDMNAPPTVQYRFAIATNNASSFQVYKTLYDPTISSLSETVPAIRPDDNYYCFRLETFDACTNTVSPGGNSPTICSENFDVTAQNNQNNLTWTTAAVSAGHNRTDFTVVRDGTNLTPNIPPGQFSSIDTDVACNTTYEYRVVGNYPGNVKSISMLKSVTAFSTDIPPAVANISTVVESTGVELTWTAATVPLKEYILTKSVNGSFGPLTTTTEPSYIDATYTEGTANCYRVSYTDQCNNNSNTTGTVEACPLQLTGAVQQDNVINLSWTDYSGWTLGVSSYTLEKYDAEGQLLESINTGTLTTYTDATKDLDNQVYTYRVFAQANDGSVIPSASNTIIVVKKPNLFYPTAFTPNKDGLNDTFKVFGQFVAKFEMKIFNRWGEMMYSTDDLDGSGWDGMYRGNLMPEGTYVFTATITDLTGKDVERTGAVYLLRKK